MMRILGVIPARGGSKGVPRKNIRSLGGRPLMSYTISAAKESKITHLVVSTEDDEIASVAKSEGVEVIMRPEHLAQDETPTHPVIIHVLDHLKAKGHEFDAVFTLQVTSPFRNAHDIDHCIKMLESSDADSIISVAPVGHGHPVLAKKIVNDALEDFFPEVEGTRRQDLEPAYIRNGAVYLTRMSTVRGGSLRGQHQRPYIMPTERSVNIDEPIDFILAEALLRLETA